MNPTARRVLRVLGLLLVAAAVAVGGAGIALHNLTTTSRPLLQAASFGLAMVLFTSVGLLGALLARSVVAAVVTAVVLLGGSAQYVPLFVADGEPGSGRGLRVMTQNMEFGGADAAALVREARGRDVDVLATVETTPEAAAALRAAGLAEALPYQALSDRPGVGGVTLWSRCPLTEPVREPGFAAGVLSARLGCPGGEVTVLSAHPIPPITDGPGSAGEADLLHATLDRQPRSSPVVVAGDFNATWDHARFRALRDIGYVDSADGGGDGWTPTWPIDRGFPPVLPLDHVLARDARHIGATEVFRIAGTDHAGVVATVDLG